MAHVRPAERPAVKRLRDLAERAAESGSGRLTNFLTPREAQIGSMIAASVGVSWDAWGGYPEAERRRGAFGSGDGPREDAGRRFGVCCLYAEAGKGFPPPGHGDYLGSVTGLGLERDRFGDILPDEAGAYVFVHEIMAPVLERDWMRAGRAPVRLRRVGAANPDRLPRPRLAERVVTLSSLRLDAFAAQAFGLSRTKALEPIRAGRAQLNFAPCEDPAASVEPGDVVSIRGLGRARVVAIEGESRSGRSFVRIGRYV